ncbi:aspartic peptidase domain-containing protein [Mycena vulgaris]|nr:aspartic peptidase domain-containing protein [Mycena vulgaris]
MLQAAAGALFLNAIVDAGSLMIYMTPLTVLALSFALSAAQPQHVPILHASGHLATPQHHFSAAKRTRARYGFHSRQSMWYRGATDQLYYTDISVGTPGQTFKMLVDTGSADLWVAAAACSAGCPSTNPTYDASKSSTATNIATASTAITYGSGAVKGNVLSDIVRLGQYSVPQMELMQVSQVTGGLLIGPISGLMGFGFAGIAQTTKLPFWEAILASGQAASPEMGFWLSRVQGTPNPAKEEPGGAFTFGGVNASLYSGDVEFLDLAGAQSTWWALHVSAIAVGGASIPFSSNTLAAFDTGTTLIGGPSAAVKAIWAAVPGSSTLSNGLYQFPCSTTLSITVSFGGKTWPINPIDMNLGPVSTGASQCIGGIFDLGSGGSDTSPGWVFGIAFLKNVYTVLRNTPSSIGFAQLSTVAGGTGTPNPVPSSSGSSTSTRTSTGGGSSTSTDSGGSTSTPTDGPAAKSKKKSKIGPIIGGVIGGVAIVLLIAGFFLYRWRRNKTRPSEDPSTGSNSAARAPLSFVVDDPEKVVEPDIEPGPSSPTTSPARRSVTTMKRAQAAALPHFSDIHTVPDTILHTPQGLQLLPGRESQSSNDHASSSHPSQKVASIPVHGERRVADTPPSPSPPAAGPVDSSMWEELQSLRAEVRRLAAEQTRPDAPPSYDHGDND